MDWIRWIRMQLNEKVIRVCLSIIFFFVLLFAIATVANPMSFNSNLASLFATMIGIGVGGLLTYFVFENRSRRRQHLNAQWFNHFIRQNALLFAMVVIPYIETGFKRLRFEEEYPFMANVLPLVIAKSWGTDLVDISTHLKEMSNVLYYMYLRMDMRNRYYKEDLHEVFELTRSTMGTMWPILEDFSERTSSVEIEDPVILKELFSCRESLTAFNLMYKYPGNWDPTIITLGFCKNLSVFFDDYTKLYKLASKRSLIRLAMSPSRRTA